MGLNSAGTGAGTSATAPPTEITGSTGNSNADAGSTSNISNISGNSGNTSRGRSRYNGGNGFGRDNSNKGFLGAEPKVGAVLGLIVEKMDKKLPFVQFREKLINYVGREHPMGDTLVCIIKDGSDPHVVLDTRYEPANLSAEEMKEDFKVKVYMEKLKRYMIKTDELLTNQRKLYDVIWGQCSDQLQEVIKYLDDYEDKETKKDIPWLMEQLQRETVGIDSMGNKYVNLIKAIKLLINMRQGQEESDDVYLKRMKANAESLKLAGGKHIFVSPELITSAGSTVTAKETSTEIDKFLGFLLLLNADQQRYGDLQKELAQDAQLGNDNYPQTTASTYELLCRRSGRYESFGRPGRGGRNGGRGGRGYSGRGNRGMQFLQSAIPEGVTLIPGKDGTVVDFQCYRCQDFGHLANNCPSNVERPRGSAP